jgi:hypothetical protein
VPHTTEARRDAEHDQEGKHTHHDMEVPRHLCHILELNFGALRATFFGDDVCPGFRVPGG